MRSRRVGDRDGRRRIVFFIISTFGRCLAATCLLGSYLGLLQHGRAVTSDAVQGLQNWDCCSLPGELLHQMRYWGSATGTVAVSRARAEAPQYFVFPFFFFGASWEEESKSELDAVGVLTIYNHAL